MSWNDWIFAKASAAVVPCLDPNRDTFENLTSLLYLEQCRYRGSKVTRRSISITTHLNSNLCTLRTQAAHTILTRAMRRGCWFNNHLPEHNLSKGVPPIFFFNYRAKLKM